ncbi:MAG: DNA translocase FtsK, partial [Roseimicrobium sp.]
PAIPATTWCAVRQKIEAASGKYLDVIVLDDKETARIYAARTLVEESIAGDIPYTKKEALDFLRGKLRPLWEKLKTAGDAVDSSAPEEAVKTATCRVFAPFLQSKGTSTTAEIAAKIEATFADFNLEVRVTDCIEAAQLLRYRLQLREGVRVVSLAARLKDLQAALHLAEPPLFDAAPGVVTLDIPRPQPITVAWRELMQRPAARALPSAVAFPVGVGVRNEIVIADLANPNTCHMLVGGAVASGKSEFLKSVVASLVARNDPASLQISIVDPKILAFNGIGSSPFLANPVLSSLDDALILLRKAVEEMDARCEQLAREGFITLKQRCDKGLSDMPYHVLVFDEFADLIVSGRAEKREFEALVARIAAKGRAAGIHLILATQRPDRSIVTGLISANLPLKVCLRVNKDVNSRIILGETGAERLLGRGDLQCDLGKGVTRCQSPLIEHDEFLVLMRRR